MSPKVRIALVGDRNDDAAAHRAIPLALALAGEDLEVRVEGTWRPTVAIDERSLGEFGGIWCVPASPYASMDGALRAIRYARTRGVPFLGTCGGFQHALIEAARNVAGLESADHLESNPGAVTPLVGPLECPLVETPAPVRFVPGTSLREAMGTDESTETFHCRFGLNPAFRDTLDRAGLRVAARGPGGEVRAVEIAGHPFFVATLFQPERASLKERLHPAVKAFVAAAARNRP